MNNIKKYATWGRIGFLPAPGTLASLISVFIVIFLSYGSNLLSAVVWDKSYGLSVYNIIACVLVLFQFFIIKEALPFFTKKDPSEIVADEFAGILVTFLLIPVNYKTVLLGFCLFRYFDISKNFGISYVEKLPGAWGILLDDVFAGLFSCGFLHLFLYFGLV